MANYDLFLYDTNSVSYYSATNLFSTAENSFFPSGSEGDPDADGAKVKFGNLNGDKITVNDNDTAFTDGDTGLFTGQTSNTTFGLFNLDGGIEPEYAYTLTDPSSGESFRIFAVVANTLTFGNTVVGFASEQEVDPTVVYNVSYNHNPWGYSPDDEPSVAYSNLVVCFTNGTMIKTTRGSVAVEDLTVGDLVLTVDHGLQPIRWIGARSLDREMLDQNPNLRPIRIRAGSLGLNTPSQDLELSPQHRIMARSPIVQRMFGESEVLVAAKHLTNLPGIDVVEDCEGVTYFHLLFDRHEVIWSNGAQTESFYTGPQALKSVPQNARDEIFQLFPNLKDPDFYPEPARPFSKGRKVKNLTKRLISNKKLLYVN